MSRNNGNEIIAALDIGTSKILALVAEINEQKELKVIGFGTEPSRGLKKGVVVNIEATVNSIDQAIREAEKVADCEINTVFAGIAGSHVRSFDGHGIVRINEGEVSQEDIDGVIDASQAMSIPSDQRILHVLPKDFVIDGQEGVREPIGMSGVRLEADVHIVTVSRSAEQNIIKSMERCGLEVQQIILGQLASSFSVLSNDEKDLGVCLVDIGGGTSDIVVFMGGQIVATKVIPIGGNHVTNDIAYALRTPEKEAEEIKIKHACTTSKMGVEIGRSKKMEPIEYQYDHYDVLLMPFKIIDYVGHPSGLEGQELIWCAIDQLKEIEILPADRSLVEKLAAEL